MTEIGDSFNGMKIGSPARLRIHIHDELKVQQNGFNIKTLDKFKKVLHLAIIFHRMLQVLEKEVKCVHLLNH